MQVSEAFFSIQGEGATNGKPVFFIRLKDCNLICGGPRGCLVGKEVEGKPCSWWCDTELQWRQGIYRTNEEVHALIEAEGRKYNIPLIEWLKDQTANFVWTGGEPALERNRQDIESFMIYWDQLYPSNSSYHEVETNGTILCPAIQHNVGKRVGNLEHPLHFYKLFDQINCSPKLANAGMKKSIRVVPETILQIKEHSNSWFKFVINFEEDIQEIRETYLEPFKIEAQKVILMPGVDNVRDLPDVTRFLFEMCKKYGFRGVTRGHILAWNKTVGV